MRLECHELFFLSVLYLPHIYRDSVPPSCISKDLWQSSTAFGAICLRYQRRSRYPASLSVPCLDTVSRPDAQWTRRPAFLRSTLVQIRVKRMLWQTHDFKDWLAPLYIAVFFFSPFSTFTLHLLSFFSCLTVQFIISLTTLNIHKHMRKAAFCDRISIYNFYGKAYFPVGHCQLEQTLPRAQPRYQVSFRYNRK